MTKISKKTNDTIYPQTGWGGELNEAQKKAFSEGADLLSKISTAEEVKESGSKVDIPFQEAMNALAAQQTEQEFKSWQLTELEQEFEKNYKASVDKVADTIDNEIRNNDCFVWTSYSQGATEYDLLGDVIIENARRGVKQEMQANRTIVGKAEEDALALQRAQMDINIIKSYIDYRFKNIQDAAKNFLDYKLVRDAAGILNDI